jgi:hypothetical protein
MIVLVFDPLALVLILAAQQSIRWAREDRDQGKLPAEDVFVPPPQVPEPETFDRLAYLKDGAGMFFKNLKPMVAKNAEPNIPTETVYVDPPPDWGKTPIADDSDEHEPPSIKAAIQLWKSQNPNKTLKEERRKFARGEITELPWLKLTEDNAVAGSHTGFGTEFPPAAKRGDTFVRVDQLPTMLYKFNGNDWIIVDKTLTDNYTYDEAYINHLISQISSGQYDPDDLSDAERDQIEQRLKSPNE